MTLNYVIEKSLVSDLEEIREDLQNIQNNLKDIIQDETLIFDSKLILDELICNGIRHGNQLNRNKTINVFINLCQEFLKIEIADEGNGFNYDEENYDPMKLSTGGRGLKIVDGLSDEFYIEGNKVVSIKYL